MSRLSTPQRYGQVAVALHWAIAAALGLALVTGFAADATGQAGGALLQMHVAAGGAAALLTVLRAAWWVFADTRPQPAGRGFARAGARVVHLLLYIVPLGMAASGIGMLILTGAGPAILAGAGAALPDFEQVLPRRPHGVGGRALLALVILHAAAAAYHGLVLRDGLLQRLRWR